MKDPRLVDLRLKADKDKRLSDGAARLLALVVSDRYLDPQFFAENEFPLPASKAQAWTGLTDEHDVYRRIRNLVSAGYMRLGEVRGCPPQRFYFLCLNTGKNPRIEAGKNPRDDSGQKPRLNTGKKPPPLISNPFGKELSQRESNGSASGVEESNEEKSRSLRSARELSEQARKEAALLAALKRSTA